MRRRILIAIGVILTGLSLWAAVRYSGEISFYLRLYRVSRIARQFYAEYKYITKDIAYSADSSACLDVYTPATGTGHPVVVFFHGGGWYQFSKLVYAPVAMKLVPHDIVVVMVGYTLYPAADAHQMTREAAAAIAWTLEHIAEYGGDPARVVVAGQSAGAHLAMLSTLDAQYLAALGHSSAELRGLIGISGVYDVAAEDAFLRTQRQPTKLLEEVMGGTENYAARSPLSYVRADLPPVLLIHGDADTTVSPSISTAFHEALQATGAQSELVIYPGHGHAELLFYALADEQEELVQTLVAWIEQHTQ